MNLPNKITLLRIFLIPIFIVCMYIPVYGSIFAAIVFIIASVTDWLDGYLARSLNLVTNFGKFADPLADKLLITAALLCLIESKSIWAWLAFIIIAREFIITGLRIIAVSEGVVIAASYWGKVKTTVQIVAVSAILLFGYLNLSFLSISLSNWLMLVTASVTLISGIDYILKNKELLNK